MQSVSVFIQLVVTEYSLGQGVRRMDFIDAHSYYRSRVYTYICIHVDMCMQIYTHVYTHILYTSTYTHMSDRSPAVKYL